MPLLRRPRLVLAAALAATLLALLPASRLRLDASLTGLLPEGSPAADAYRAFLADFGGVETVFVALRGPRGEELADAAARFAEIAARSPEVARARAGLDEAEERFVLEEVAPRLPVLVAPEALEAALAPGARAERIREILDLASSPMGSLSAPLAAADPLGLSRDLLARAAGPPIDPATGAFLSADGTTALVLVTPARPAVDPAAGRALEQVLEQVLEQARAGSGLTMEAIGGPLYAAHDERALRRDLVVTAAAALLAVGLLIAVAFDGIAMPLAALLALLAGNAWTAALLATGWGTVSALGIGVAAILVGLGDDYVLHLAARFRDLLRGGGDPDAAMRAALAETGPGIVTAALTTAAAFGVLAFAHLRPLRELGTAVSLGVILLLATALLVAAPVLVLAGRRWAAVRPRRAWEALGRAIDHAVHAGARHRRLVLGIALLGTALSAVGIPRLSFDPDLRRLRPAGPTLREAEERLAREFGLGADTATVVVRGGTRDEAIDRAAGVRERLAAELGPAVRIASPSDWLPSDERTRRAGQVVRADDVEALAREMAASGLEPAAFAASLSVLRTVAGGGDPGAPGEASWPDGVAETLRRTREGWAAAVHLRLPAGTWPQGPPPDLLAQLPGAEVASVPRLGAELRAHAWRDLERLGALSALLVGAIVLVSFRGRLRPSLLALAPVLLGTVWTFGVWGWLGRPIDLFAAAVLPILLGLGVDDGLHVLHAARRGTSLADAAAAAGRGVVLTNLTTCLGFAALALSRVPALRNGGLLVATGNLLCLAATLLVLPALDGKRGGPEAAPLDGQASGTSYDAERIRIP